MENQQKNELQKSKVIEFEKNISDSLQIELTHYQKMEIKSSSKLFSWERNYISVVNFAKYV